MKKIILLLLIVVVALQLDAQIEYDKWDEIIPFSLTEKYKNIINTKDIHSFITPDYDNDSLFKVHNNGKTHREVGTSYAAGKSFDKEIDLKKEARKFNLKEGTLWIYTIESNTAKSVGFFIKDLDIPEGAYFAYYPGLIPYEIEEPEVLTRDMILKGKNDPGFLKNGLSIRVSDKKIIIEYFEPAGIGCGVKILINQYTYFFAERMNNSINDENNSLKSGGWTNTPALACQKDVVCPEVVSWKNQAKSVVFIQMYYKDNQNIGYFSQCTGFFLNKSGGYSDTDFPIIVTCGHLYYPSNDGINYIDVSQTASDPEIYVDYENLSCDETKTRWGKKLRGSFSRTRLGTSYNTIKQSTYDPSEDYAVFLASRTVKKLSDYKIEYAAWTNNFDLSNINNTGYAYIGHPRGDVKKVNIDNSRAWVHSNGKEFGLYCDIGAIEKGFSGGPVFYNNSRQVVGWVCTQGTGSLVPCSEIGKEDWVNRTGCGRFNNLYSIIVGYIDPTGIGSATSSNPLPPNPSALPAQCRNCMQDNGETGIDCGGPCFPCGMLDVVGLKTMKDIAGPVKSRYELIADPDPNTTLNLKSGDFSFEAGLNIYLNGGFEVSKGAVFYASINKELTTEADRGCQTSCVNASMPYFTPNGDGSLDYFYIRQAFVVSYDIKVFDRWGKLEYSDANILLFNNGYINVWDGSGASSGGQKMITITARDCNGNATSYVFWTELMNTTKSAIISTDISVIPITSNESSVTKIKVYPNPFSNKVIINYSGEIFPLEYKITDANGKVILTNKTTENTKTINLTHFAAGTYIIHAKAGDYNLVQQLIKK